MKILLLNQTFYPDVASTAQHLSDLALGLAARGHEVTVVTSRRAYDDPDKYFPPLEIWRGVRIIRIGSTGFGKGAKWKRAADFASFMLLCTLRIVSLPRYDVVLALTSPPLISFLGAWVAKLRGSRFFYWVMDFNPDEAIAAGWLTAGSPVARVLEAMSRFSLRRAKKIIALDRFMQERIGAKGIPAEKIAVLPPWSHDDEVRFDDADLSGANLTYSDLTHALMVSVDLSGANLTGTQLGDVDFTDSDLSGVDFRSANLHGANLSDAELDGAILPDGTRYREGMSLKEFGVIGSPRN